MSLPEIIPPGRYVLTAPDYDGDTLSLQWDTDAVTMATVIATSAFGDDAVVELVGSVTEIEAQARHLLAMPGRPHDDRLDGPVPAPCGCPPDECWLPQGENRVALGCVQREPECGGGWFIPVSGPDFGDEWCAACGTYGCSDDCPDNIDGPVTPMTYPAGAPIQWCPNSDGGQMQHVDGWWRCPVCECAMAVQAIGPGPNRDGTIPLPTAQSPREDKP